MAKFLLSFFAIIGIVLMAINLCDFFFYRKFKTYLPLIVDLRDKSDMESIEILEMIATARQRKSGRAAISELMIMIRKDQGLSKDDLYRYMRVLRLPGTVYDNIEIQTKKAL